MSVDVNVTVWGRGTKKFYRTSHNPLIHSGYLPCPDPLHEPLILLSSVCVCVCLFACLCVCLFVSVFVSLCVCVFTGTAHLLFMDVTR